MGSLPSHVCPASVKALKIMSPYCLALTSKLMSSSCVTLGFLSVVMAPMLISPARSLVLNLGLTSVCLTFPHGISNRHLTLPMFVLELQVSIQTWSSLCLCHPRKCQLCSSHGSGQVLPSTSTLLFPSYLKDFHYNSAESTFMYSHVRPCVYGYKCIHYLSLIHI